jgi:hypothetical protein
VKGIEGRCSLVCRQPEASLERGSRLLFQRNRSGVGVTEPHRRLEDAEKQLVQIERAEERRQLACTKRVLLGPLDCAPHLPVRLGLAG